MIRAGGKRYAILSVIIGSVVCQSVVGVGGERYATLGVIIGSVAREDVVVGVGGDGETIISV